MKKDNIKRLVASISAIAIMTSLSGCHKKLTIDDILNDTSINQLHEDDNLKELAQLYKERFFYNLPILKLTSFNQEYIDSLFNYPLLNKDFTENYVFLAHYLNYLKQNNEFNGSKIFIDNKSDNNYSNDVTLSFREGNDYYEMTYYNNVVNFYDSVTEVCQNDFLSFRKKFSYSCGDISSQNNLANCGFTYELNLKYNYNDYTFMLIEENQLNKKDNKINYLNSNKQILLYCNNELIVQDTLSEKDFSEYVNDIYAIYINRNTLGNYFNDRENKANKAIKLIKKQGD